MGKIIFIAGLVLMITGLVIMLCGNRLHFPGRLPGDIRIEKENFRFYFPITTMILISVIISLILWIIQKLRG